MSKRVNMGLLALLLLTLLAASGSAEVEGDIQGTLKLTEVPVDVAVSLNGKWLFVLTRSGSIQVYTPDGRLEGQVSVDSRVDGVRVGPREDLLLLYSSQDKTVQILALDFIRPINVSGSPYKGTDDAPVVIAVFSDFE